MAEQGNGEKEKESEVQDEDALPETHNRDTNSERECFGVYWSLKKFREYLRESQTIVFSDHQSLTEVWWERKHLKE